MTESAEAQLRANASMRASGEPHTGERASAIPDPLLVV